MGKHDVPEDPPQSAPEWIVTFSDMISLLVTFFVMLMSFSTIEEKEAAIIAGAFGKNSTGILQRGPNSAVDDPPRDRLLATNPLRGADRPHARPAEELPASLDEMGQKLTGQHLELDFSDVSDGLLITFGEQAGFAPGSAEVSAELKTSLVELGRVLQHYPHLVVIEGHSDDRDSPTPRYPDGAALSGARAAAAAQVMLSGSDIGRDLLQVAGLGSTQPRASNETALGRAQNRRVEVRVIALSKARARMLQSQLEAREAEGR